VSTANRRTAKRANFRLSRASAFPTLFLGGHRFGKCRARDRKCVSPPCAFFATELDVRVCVKARSSAFATRYRVGFCLRDLVSHEGGQEVLGVVPCRLLSVGVSAQVPRRTPFDLVAIGVGASGEWGFPATPTLTEPGRDSTRHRCVLA
jgi:hypothetical protein